MSTKSETTKPKRRRCTCGSDVRYKPGDRISILDFCLLCWGTGTRNTPW